MSATVVRLPMPVRDPDAAFRDLLGSCADVRRAIADAESVGAAYAIYRQLQAMSEELLHLVDAAGDRCERLLMEL